MKPIRILLADDHALVRAGISALLKRIPEVEVVAEATDGREALALVKAQPPDLVLMDISMAGLNGLRGSSCALPRNTPRCACSCSLLM